MTQVSRPLIGLLVATVAFFAIYTVALKPASQSTSGGSTTKGSLQSAVNKANDAVAKSKAAAINAANENAAAAGDSPVTTGPAATTPSATAPKATTTPNTAATSPKATVTTPQKTATIPQTIASVPAIKTPHPATAAPKAAVAGRLAQLQLALAQHKVVVVLFYNPAAADDRAVKAELAAVSVPASKVLKLDVPVSELSRYTVITNQVPIASSPTLVLIDRKSQASTIAGFADRFEISQRVDQLL